MEDNVVIYFSGRTEEMPKTVKHDSRSPKINDCSWTVYWHIQCSFEQLAIRQWGWCHVSPRWWWQGNFTAFIRRKRSEFYARRNGTVTNSVEHSRRILWYPKCYYRVHKMSSLIPSQTNSVEAIPFYFLIYFNRIFPSMPRLSKMSSSPRLHIPHPRISPYLDHLCIADVSLHSPVTLSLLRPKVFLSAQV